MSKTPAFPATYLIDSNPDLRGTVGTAKRFVQGSHDPVQGLDKLHLVIYSRTGTWLAGFGTGFQDCKSAMTFSQLRILTRCVSLLEDSGIGPILCGAWGETSSAFRLAFRGLHRDHRVRFLWIAVEVR